MRIPKILKPSKKKIIALAVLVTVLFLGFNFFGSQKKPAPLQFTEVKRQDIKSVVSSSGSLTGTSVANLKFKSGGKLSYINVKAGDWVKKYQVIAGLDTRDLSITLQQAQNTLVAKDAAAKKAEDDVKNHDKDETFSQKETRTAAQVARDNAFDSVKSAQKAFEDAVIVSPIAGVVTQAIQTEGQNVGSSDLIAQIVDMSSIYFDTDVDEADITNIAVGTPCEVILDAYPRQVFKGLVDQIIPQTKTTSSGASVVTVRIILDNPELVFVNGLSGQSSIFYQASFNALTIPQEALREDNSVVVEANGKLENKKVEVGISSDTEVEIKDGLDENEKVLLNPPAAAVRPQNQSSNPLGGFFRIFGGRGR